jgi:hypothetical protein
MLFVVDQNSKTASPAAPGSFGEMALKERFDIQEWILARPQILGEELLVITAEFDQFEVRPSASMFWRWIGEANS